MNAKRNDGSTPILLAAQEGHTDVVNALIAAGADKEAKNNAEYTPLLLAAYYGRTDVVNLLRAAQNTPLVAAANGGTEEFNLENTLSPETIQLEEAPDIETSKKQRCLPKSCTIM